MNKFIVVFERAYLSRNIDTGERSHRLVKLGGIPCESLNEARRIATQVERASEGSDTYGNIVASVCMHVILPGGKTANIPVDEIERIYDSLVSATNDSRAENAA